MVIEALNEMQAVMLRSLTIRKYMETNVQLAQIRKKSLGGVVYKIRTHLK